MKKRLSLLAVTLASVLAGSAQMVTPATIPINIDPHEGDATHAPYGYLARLNMKVYPLAAQHIYNTSAGTIGAKSTSGPFTMYLFSATNPSGFSLAAHSTLEFDNVTHSISYGYGMPTPDEYVVLAIPDDETLRGKYSAYTIINGTYTEYDPIPFSRNYVTESASGISFALSDANCQLYAIGQNGVTDFSDGYVGTGDFDWGTNDRYTVTSITGEAVANGTKQEQAEPGTHKVRMHVSKKGMYVVGCNVNGSIYSQKVIVK